VVLDLNVGALTLKSGDVNMAGDLTLGYATKSLGLAATGTGLNYQLERPEQKVDILRGEVDAEAWYVTGSEETWGRFEARLRFAGVNDDRTVTTWRPDHKSFTWHDENTWMWRPSLLLGLRLRGGPNLSGYLLAGGGIQYEWYDYITVSPGASADLSDTQTLSSQGYGRAQVRWSFVPGWLSLRLRAEASRSSMTRNNERWDPNQSNFVRTRESAATFELRSRASLELDALAFLGISPFIYGGLDYFTQEVGGSAVSSTMPGFGAGLFKPMF
jgi:hypothetical protein